MTNVCGIEIVGTCSKLADMVVESYIEQKIKDRQGNGSLKNECVIKKNHIKIISEKEENVNE